MTVTDIDIDNRDVAPEGVAPEGVAGTTDAKWGAIRTGLAVYGSYLAVALWATGHVWWNVKGRVLASNPGDHTFFEWMLAHGARLVTHPENPFFSHAMNAPDGVNMMANTSVLGVAIPLSPITLIFGPEVAVATLLTLALFGTAAAWYHVLRRHLVSSWPAAFVGGALCGFAPALIAHASGQPNLVAQFLVPFIVSGMIRLPERPVRRGIVLGLLMTYQAFVNEEVLFVTCLATGVFILVYTGFHPELARRSARAFLAGVGVAAAVTAVLLAYPLYWQFFGPQAYHGLPFGPSMYPADLLSYSAYARESIGGNGGGGVLGGSPNEDNAAFGWPLLALVVLVTVRLWRRRILVRAAAITGLAFAAISLGPTIRMGGSSTGIPGPFALLTRIPPFDLAVPGRFAFVVAPVIGVLIALGCQHAIQVGPAMRRLGVPWTPLWAGVLIGAVLPVLPTPIPVTSRPPIPEFISGGGWRGYVPAGRTIVTVPLPAWRNPEPMRWQAVTGFEYEIPRGYFLGPTSHTDPQAIFGAPPRPTATKWYAMSLLPRQPKPAVGGDSPLGTELAPRTPSGAATVVSTADRQAAAADLRYWRAAIVVLPPGGRNEEALWKATTELLGFRPTWVGGLWLWDVRTLVAGE
jgi:hypothetical protein